MHLILNPNEFVQSGLALLLSKYTQYTHAFNVFANTAQTPTRKIPELASVGRLSVGRLEDSWQGASSWTQALESTVGLLYAGERVAGGWHPDVSLSVLLYLTRPLVGNTEEYRHETVTIHRLCEMENTQQQNAFSHQTSTAGLSVVKSRIFDVRPTRLANGFESITFTLLRQQRLYASVWSALGSTDAQSLINSTQTMPSKQLAGPSSYEKKCILRSFFGWRGIHSGRDVLLVGLSAGSLTTITNIEPSFALISATSTKADIPVPCFCQQTNARPIVQILLTSGHGGGLLFTRGAKALSNHMMTGYRHVKMCQDSIVFNTVYPPVFHSVPSIIKCTRLVLGPIMGVVSTSTAFVVVEVDRDVDLAIEVIPQHAWVHTALTAAHNTNIHVAASVPANRPVGLPLQGLHPATRYRYSLSTRLNIGRIRHAGTK